MPYCSLEFSTQYKKYFISSFSVSGEIKKPDRNHDIRHTSNIFQHFPAEFYHGRKFWYY
jgi:hypothetical protein